MVWAGRGVAGSGFEPANFSSGQWQAAARASECGGVGLRYAPGPLGIGPPAKPPATLGRVPVARAGRGCPGNPGPNSGRGHQAGPDAGI